jgi:hypothetical protein
METIKFIVNVFYLYLLAGVIFAALFIWRGAAKLDESAKGISWKTRALLFPPALRCGRSCSENGSKYPTPTPLTNDDNDE